MSDQSSLDAKYFIDNKVYNCPFCNRRNVVYSIIDTLEFDWTEKKKCFGFLTRCSSCNNRALHLSYKDIVGNYRTIIYRGEIDEIIFYSVPTSFHVIDERIPSVIRELISEAEGCLKMNYLTGASSCARKAIYELTVLESTKGEDYQTKIKYLKTKHPTIDSSYFDVLANIQDMTSDKVHEQSWDKWDSKHLKLIISAVKEVLYEIYVIPEERKTRAVRVNQLLEDVNNDKNGKGPGEGTGFSNESEQDEVK